VVRTIGWLVLILFAVAALNTGELRDLYKAALVYLIVRGVDGIAGTVEGTGRR
jgi:hypothetical protein